MHNLQIRREHEGWVTAVVSQPMVNISSNTFFLGIEFEEIFNPLISENFPSDVNRPGEGFWGFGAKPLTGLRKNMDFRQCFFEVFPPPFSQKFSPPFGRRFIQINMKIVFAPARRRRKFLIFWAKKHKKLRKGNVAGRPGKSSGVLSWWLRQSIPIEKGINP